MTLKYASWVEIGALTGEKGTEAYKFQERLLMRYIRNYVVRSQVMAPCVCLTPSVMECSWGTGIDGPLTHNVPKLYHKIRPDKVDNWP